MDDLLNAVTLVVKAPNQKVADQTVQCGMGWTIRKLKSHLSAVYPSKPVSCQTCRWEVDTRVDCQLGSRQ